MKIDTEVDMKGNNIINCPSLVDIDDTIISNGKTWSSEKISKINISDAKKVDSKPTYSDGTITYVKDGTSYTTTNSKQWFYYLENGSLKQTIFIDGEELTIDGTSVDFSEYIKKTSIATTLDSSCTNDQVAGAKDVYDKAIKDKNLKTYTSLKQLGLTEGSETLSDIATNMINNSMAILNIQSSCNVSEYPLGYGVLVVNRMNVNRVSFIFTETGGSNTLRQWVASYNGGKINGWKRVCTTSVGDVPNTIITATFPDTFTVSKAYIMYSVKNGWANIQIALNITAISSASTKWVDIASGLPKPDKEVNTSSAGEKGSIGNIGFRINTNGILEIIAQTQITSSDWWNINFSYPVAES